MGAHPGAVPGGKHPRKPSGAQTRARTRSLGGGALDSQHRSPVALPQCYPNYKTVHRRFQQWCTQEVLRNILVDLADALREEGELDERESFIDATFFPAKGGGGEVGWSRRGKGVKILAIVDRGGLPLSVSTHAANHHEARCVKLSLHFYLVAAKPEKLIYDKAFERAGSMRSFGRRASSRWRSPVQPDGRQDAGRKIALPPPALLIGGAFLRVASMETSAPDPSGALRRELPRASCKGARPRCWRGDFGIR